MLLPLLKTRSSLSDVLLWCSPAGEIHAGLLFSKKTAKKGDVQFLQIASYGVRLGLHSCKTCFPRVTEKGEDESVLLLGIWSTQMHFFIRGIWNSDSLRKSKRSLCWPAVFFLGYVWYQTMPYAKSIDHSYGLETTVFITVGRLLVLMVITVSPCELLLFQICPLGSWGQKSFSSASLLGTEAPHWH